MIATLGCMAGWFARALASVAVLAVLGMSALSGMSAWADGVVLSQPVAETRPEPAQASYDETQPGADDPRVKEGFAAYQAGDFKKAYALWLPPAEAGNAEAQFRIGRLYDFGEGVEKNYDKGIRWYKAADTNNHLSATFNLGHLLYWEGRGNEDKRLAIDLLNKAAMKGHIDAQLHLGISLAAGDVFSRNYVEAFKWMYISLMNGNLNSEGTISKLESITSSDVKALGYERMREWFVKHPRTQ
jgi:TPR repeat protein